MRTIVLLLALGACSQQPAQQPADQRAEVAPPAAQAPAQAQPPAQVATPAAPAVQAAMISVPTDPAKLKKLEVMGYTAHMDHLHAPGVTTCPKTGDDPIM
ncbi:MAG: hypothetical protein H0U34_00240 [Sphingomonas sp.]|jgi:hypothetical protein|nr:hypothetical protein [Sphingomonas sp.]